MVHLDKTEGQKGSMVLTEDGSIISSSGDLASSESTANNIMGLLTQTLKVDFNGQMSNNAGQNNNNAYLNAGMDSDTVVAKWNRVTVNFGDHSYVACLSNKKIHVVKRDATPSTQLDNVDH